MGTSITDVAGIRIGHAQRTDEGWLTGVTVVLPPQGTVGSVDVRGGGPATHETDALDPTALVPTVDAVALCGGSAYGLSAAHGVQRWCEEQGRGFAVAGGVVPIVPAAAIFDIGRGGQFGNRPDTGMGYSAALAAAAEQDRHDVGRGNVGAGTGAVIGMGQYKGGAGTASVELDGENSGLVVGAIVIVNAFGTPTVADQGAPRRAETRRAETRRAETPRNTTLAVVATNADLDPAQCKRTAIAAQAGIARALNPSHTMADGDTIFALSTRARTLAGEGAGVVQSMIQLQSAAATAIELAVADGVEQAAAVRNPTVDLPRWGT
ncbi:P1 family peptidase [Arthrobacter castelli]|uniref:P1 family peptidase n=1 Tax=Arthrobacter castelli TaxID=271431 RepID=UPI00041C4C7E|nr:P1 family peptidase [Arthrobacter castelli]